MQHFQRQYKQMLKKVTMEENNSLPGSSTGAFKSSITKENEFKNKRQKLNKNCHETEESFSEMEDENGSVNETPFKGEARVASGHSMESEKENACFEKNLREQIEKIIMNSMNKEMKVQQIFSLVNKENVDSQHETKLSGKKDRKACKQNTLKVPVKKRLKTIDSDMETMVPTISKKTSGDATTNKMDTHSLESESNDNHVRTSTQQLNHSQTMQDTSCASFVEDCSTHEDVSNYNKTKPLSKKDVAEGSIVTKHIHKVSRKESVENGDCSSNMNRKEENDDSDDRLESVKSSVPSIKERNRDNDIVNVENDNFEEDIGLTPGILSSYVNTLHHFIREKPEQVFDSSSEESDNLESSVVDSEYEGRISTRGSVYKLYRTLVNERMPGDKKSHPIAYKNAMADLEKIKEVLSNPHCNKAGRKLYVCVVCNLSDYKFEILLQHVKSSHCTLLPKFCCSECSFENKSHSLLMNHVRKRHVGNSYTCFICGKVLVSRRMIKQHLETHNPKYQYLCMASDCGYHTTTKKSFIKHASSKKASYSHSLSECKACCVKYSSEHILSEKHKKNEQVYRCLQRLDVGLLEEILEFLSSAPTNVIGSIESSLYEIMGDVNTRQNRFLDSLL